MDFCLLPVLAPREEGPYVTKRLVHIFSKDKTIQGEFRRHIVFTLSIMIFNFFEDKDECEDLWRLIHLQSEMDVIHEIIDDEFNGIYTEKCRLEIENADFARKCNSLSEENVSLSEENESYHQTLENLKKQGILTEEQIENAKPKRI